MSVQNNDKAPVLDSPKTQTADDIFGKLSEDDDLDSLDLTKPLPDKSGKDGEDKSEKEQPEIKLDDKDEITDKEDEDEEIELDELEQIEEDLKEIDADKLELKTPVARREILKKYPNLFKDFPYLETAYYREQQFTEILSTIEDAKAAAESHQILQRYTEDMVEKGNVKNVLKMIKESNPETYARVVDDYMDHLKEIDPQAHVHVQSNLVKNIILGMVEEARSSNDDDLRTAALLLNKWAFGSSKFVPPQRMSKEEKPEEKTKEAEISQREQEFIDRQVQAATTEVNNRVNNTIKGAIENNIDPNGQMTEYVKRNAVRDAQEKIANLIGKDSRFQKIVEKLWEKAAKNNFSSDSLNEIRKAYLAKGKSLLAPVIQSARKEALKGMGKRVKEEATQDEETEQPRRERIQRQERSLSSDKDKARIESMRGASSFDKLNALMGD